MLLTSWLQSGRRIRQKLFFSQPVMTYTAKVYPNGNVTSRTQTHGNSFAKSYGAFQSVRNDVEQQIFERHKCPANPANNRPLTSTMGTKS